MEFRILGPLEVRGEAGPVALGGQAAGAVGGVAAQCELGGSSDRLIDALWEEEPPATAHKALQVYVSQLRKQLGRERLGTEAAGYVLRVHADELDLVRFERLRREGRLSGASEISGMSAADPRPSALATGSSNQQTSASDGRGGFVASRRAFVGGSEVGGAWAGGPDLGASRCGRPT